MLKKIIFLIIFCYNISYCQSDVMNVSGIRNDKNYFLSLKITKDVLAGTIESFNLKDSVKSVSTYFTKVETKNDRLLAFTEINLKYYPYIELDSTGMLNDLIVTTFYNIVEDTATIEQIKSETYNGDKIKRINRFHYFRNKKDFLEKSKYQLHTSIPYGAFDGRKMKLDSYVIFPDIDVAYKNSKQIKKNIYQYELNENGSIKTEKHFIIERRCGNKEFIQEIDSLSSKIKAPTYFNTDYLYDENGNLIYQKICIVNKWNSVLIDVEDILDGFISDESEIFYTYQNNKLTGVRIALPNVENYISEKYFYDETQTYISKVVRYGKNDIYSNDAEYYYNNFGDITEVYYTDKGKYSEHVPKRQFYVYEYDNHNNWIKCNLYLEGAKNSEPNFIAERKIEYFNK